MKSSLLLLASALLLLGSVACQVDPDGPAISPFRGMRKVEGGIEVQVRDDTWYGLESVAGVDTARLLREAKRLCGRSDWKRITEDLPALLDAMGEKVDSSVDLKLRSLTTGDFVELLKVEMTHANRQRVREANKGGRALPILGEIFGRKLAANEVRQDLDVLQKLLDTRFAYRELRGVDLKKLLRAARRELGTGQATQYALAQSVDRIVRAFGDGHSRVRDIAGSNALWLPCLVQQVDGGYVAFRADRRGFVDEQRPFLVAIDGVPLEKWLLASAERVTQGSPTMIARDAERGLRQLTSLRRALDLPSKEMVRLTLRGPDGERTVSVKVVARKPVYGSWPRTATRRLDGDIGYLRIERMLGELEFLDGLDTAMAGFKDTLGLIIDVRGNGGGWRDALRRLAPYFLPKDGTAIVGNVGAILLESKQPAAADALADRYLYRADWSGWNHAQRDAIGKFLKGFKPSWKLPRGKFSPWHFLVLDRQDNEQAFHYGKPVVVLIDRSCFSATDIFTAALQAIPGVTLVGETSSGGSGRARGFRLPNSGIRLQLSSMASFRPDGTLFEGNGVEPDVVVATRARDLIGQTDTVLVRALELLK